MFGQTLFSQSVCGINMVFISRALLKVLLSIQQHHAPRASQAVYRELPFAFTTDKGFSFMF